MYIYIILYVDFCKILSMEIKFFHSHIKIHSNFDYIYIVYSIIYKNRRNCIVTHQLRSPGLIWCNGELSEKKRKEKNRRKRTESEVDLKVGI